MAKIIPYLKTQEKGYFTPTQREHIKNNEISKDERYKLLKIPKGRLFKQLTGQINDLDLMIMNKECSFWLIDYNVKKELTKLRDLLDGILGFHSIPLRRLAATKKDGKRKYYLKPIDIRETPESDVKRESYRRNQMIVGLKPYEKKFISKYIEKIGYNLPLEEKEFYTWNEVKKKLLEVITKKDEPITKKDERIIEKRIDQAWKMINEKFNEKQKNEMIAKTGFGIRLMPYSQFKD